METKDYFKELTKEELKKLLPFLPPKHQQFVNEYIQFGDYKVIARSNNEFRSDAKARMERANRAIEILLEEGLLDEEIDTKVARDIQQIRAFLRVKKKLESYKALIDFETELYPFLSDNYRAVLENCMENLRHRRVEVSNNLGNANGYSSNAIPLIFNKIESIVEKKQFIQSLYDQYGGKEGLEDLVNLLTKNQKDVFNKYVLSIAPRINDEEIKQRKLNPSMLKKYAIERLEILAQRRQSCKEFVEKYGEHFLLNDFGSRLSEEQFYVLKNYIMDYHYSNLQKDSVSIGRSEDFIASNIQLIKNALDKYVKHRQEIDTLIKKAGGWDNIQGKFVPRLTPIKKAILLGRTLSYNPERTEDIAKEFGRARSLVSYYDKRLRLEFGKFATEQEYLR